MSIANAFEKLDKYRKLRQRMIVLPILGVEAVTTPLTVGDDLTLRTMVVTPELYDQEITKLIYSHIEFPSLPKRPTFSEFLERLSAFDRSYALWGIFICTYETFGVQHIKCPKCNEEWDNEIKIEELIQPDFVNKIWKNDLPFIQYTYNIDIDLNSEDISKIRFVTCIPTIKKRLDVLKTINSEIIKRNMDRYGGIFSRVDEISLITKSIEVHSPDGSNPEIIEGITNITRALNQYIPEQITKKALEIYNGEHDKYVPEFKKQYGCNVCGHEFNFYVNMEMSLFQQFFRTS
jgi:hypothetical protein